MTRLMHRAWNNDTKKWVHLTSNIGTTFWVNNDLVGAQDCIDLDRYTGADSTHCSSIFENDIVGANIYSGEIPLLLLVYFDKGAFWINYHDGESDRFVIGEFPGRLAIIGNTRDNPDIVLD